MASQKASKLNHLQRTLPEGLVVDAAWLDAHGYAHPLRQKYVANGWLDMLTRGVYRRPLAGLGQVTGPENVDWRLLIASLSSLLGYDVHVGGRMALSLTGHAHYLSMSPLKTVDLYADKLPAWLARVPTDVAWRIHRTAPLFDASILAATLPAPTFGNATTDPLLLFGRSRMSVDRERWTFPVAIPERAILELLDELPGAESFEQADKIMDGLANLRPRLQQHLLEACRSVKVKRLFLFLAERHGHAWLAKLDRSRIDLGVGKRALVANGRYDKKFQITVPEFLLQKQDDY